MVGGLGHLGGCGNGIAVRNGGPIGGGSWYGIGYGFGAPIGGALSGCGC